jgi:FkbM family methyltransferase
MSSSALSTIGLIRSLLVYYATPFRLRQLRRLYAGFLKPGDLAFDLGAHVGNRMFVWLRLGARVVALEPHPVLFRFLERWFGRHPRVTLIPAAAGAATGQAELWMSRRTPTVSSLSSKWREEVRRAPGFAGVAWEEKAVVPVVTLDSLIAEHGLPAFCKIDVEGSEHDVLYGLSQPLPALSLEYLPAARDQAAACVDRLRGLGRYEFQWTVGEGTAFRAPVWTTAESVQRFLQQLPAAARSGDLYARRQPRVTQASG